jgi:hypothetical protein
MLWIKAFNIIFVSETNKGLRPLYIPDNGISLQESVHALD